MHPFTPGKEYRRDKLLKFVGSRQQQSGVLWGVSEPGCLICTSGGRHGKKAGYGDELLPDGSWYYFGQGQKGDQLSSNAANAKLAAGGKSVLLFSTREPSSKEVVAQGDYRKLFVFRGSFNVSSFESVVPKFGTRKGDKLLRFRLLPADAVGEDADSATSMTPHESFGELRQMLIAAVGLIGASVNLTLTEYWKRSARVRRYALLRAAGRCEACRSPAPFVDKEGTPFLEVHHLHRLADEGIDAPQNVAAVCPNCHRRAHLAVDRIEFGNTLSRRIEEIERDILLPLNGNSPTSPLSAAEVVRSENVLPIADPNA